MKKRVYFIFLTMLLTASCSQSYYECMDFVFNGCPPSTIKLKENGTFKFRNPPCFKATNPTVIEGTFTKHDSQLGENFLVLRYRCIENLILVPNSNFQIHNENAISRNCNIISFKISEEIDTLLSNQTYKKIAIRLDGDSMKYLTYPVGNDMFTLEVSDNIKSFKLFIGSSLLSSETIIKKGISAYNIRYADVNPYNHTCFLEDDINKFPNSANDFYFNEYVEDTLFIVNDTLYLNQTPEFIRKK